MSAAASAGFAADGCSVLDAPLAVLCVAARCIRAFASCAVASVIDPVIDLLTVKVGRHGIIILSDARARAQN